MNDLLSFTPLEATAILHILDNTLGLATNETEKIDFFQGDKRALAAAYRGRQTLINFINRHRSASLRLCGKK